MKTILILLPLCLCLINLLSISAAAAAQPPPPVLDMDGQELLTRANYYILLVTEDSGHGSNGGISLYDVGNKRCPLDVVVELDTASKVYFRPVNNPKDGVVRLSTDFNIIFNITTTGCPEPPQWKLDYDESIRRHLVSTGGVVGNPGPKTVNSWFKIEQFGSGYKFVFCPSVCKTCRHECGDVGILEQGYNNRRLVLSIDEDEFDGPFMDGYAVIASDGPGVYPVIIESRAGNDGIDAEVTPGTIAYVTTGGMIGLGRIGKLKLSLAVLATAYVEHYGLLLDSEYSWRGSMQKFVMPDRPVDIFSNEIDIEQRIVYVVWR